MTTAVRSRRGRSAAVMGAGVAAVGASGFGFLAIVGHTLSSEEAVAVTALYMIINIIGPGLFYSLEQETNRVVSSGLAGGVDPGAGVRRAAGLGLILASATTVLVLAASPILVRSNFGGHEPFVLWLVLGTFCAAAVFFVRGVLAACREFGGYSATLAVEAAVRLLPCAAIAAVGLANQDLYGLAFAIGGGVAALAVLPMLRQCARRFRPATELTTEPTTGPATEPTTEPTTDPTTEPAIDPARPPEESVRAVRDGHRFGHIAGSLGLLATATLLAQVVANLAPVVVSARLVDQAAVASAFAFAFVLSRVPLLLYGPVQSMLMPVLTASAVRADHAGLRRTVRTALLVVAGVGVPGALLGGLVGPWAVVTFFGAQARPSALVMALLTWSSVLLMATQIVQPALVALGRQRTVSVAWIAGTAVLVALLAVPVDPIAAAVIAQLVGPALVVGVCAVDLTRVTSRTGA